MDAEEALVSGLVSRKVPAKKLLDEALSVAGKIADKSQLAVTSAKQAVHAADEMSLSAGCAYERSLFQALFSTEDQKEGMQAFIEKREAQFRDK